LTWSRNGQKLSVAGSLCVKSYEVNITSEASLHMELLKAEESGSSSSYLKFSTDGRYLAYDLQRKIGIIRQKEEKRNGIQWSNAPYITSVLTGHSQPIKSICWSPNSYILAASELNGAIYIWDVQKSKCSQKLEAHISSVNTLDWRQESTLNAETVSLLASGGQDGRLVVYDVGASKVLRSMSSSCEILGVSWSPTQDNILVSYGTDRTLAFTNINDWKQIKVFGNTNPILKAQWSPNGKYLAAVDNEAIRIWDISMMRVLKTITRDNTNKFKSNTNTILSGKAPIISDIHTALAAFDYSSRYLACTICNYDRIPAIFDISNDKFLEKQTTVSHRAPITCLEWSSTRPVLATGSYDHNIMLWGVDSEN
jgi:WD40 repeat protein